MPPASPRPYRQVARAAAAQETQRRIVEAFRAALRAGWMDEITLDDIAAAAGTTRQTVIRLFGSKEGVLRAVAQKIGAEVEMRRHVAPGAPVAERVRVLVQDYEASGDFILRLLAQEARYPDLTALLEIGRREHRRWVAETFLPPGRAGDAALLDLLVVATDAYTWKLLRRDMGHPAGAVAARMALLIERLLNPPPHTGREMP